MTRPLYTLFYTVGSPYEQEAEKCIETLDKFRLPRLVHGVESRGSWEKNTQIKAEVIRDTLLAHPGPVVYIDADARVENDPVLLDQIECDVAFHYFRGVELLSGTLFLGNTPRCRSLVDEWIAENQRFPGQWDQKTLQLVVERHKDIDWLLLPEEYVYIDKLAHTKKPPVIRHLQASRQYKKAINGA